MDSNLVICLACITFLGRALAWPAIDSLPTNRPWSIAHRGASGMLPEHTKEAHQLAVQQGADILECDVCITQDLRLVCLHESWLGDTTDAEEKFPNRVTTKYIDDIGIEITDVFSVDLTLNELKTLRKDQRSGSRDPNYDGEFEIITLEELILIAQSANRTVGIYPETKHPMWVNNLDIIQDKDTTFEDLILDELKRHGYNSSTDPCFIQSFSETSLRAFSQRTQLPLVMLMVPILDDTSDERLRELATFCYGIGPNKAMIVSVGLDGRVDEVTDLPQRAHAAGLRVHPYTFRNEDSGLAWDFGLDPQAEYDLFNQAEVDGFFTDFPLTLTNYFKVKYPEPCP